MKNKTNFKRFGVMIDSSRNAVLKPDATKKLLELMEKMGYNMLMLYTEDTYEMDNHPYFGHRRGKYTKAELKEIDAYAKKHNIELIPCIQTLGHLDYLMKSPKYGALRDMDNCLLADDEKTYELIEDMFKTVAECFTTKVVNIGMDETHPLGRGRHLDIYGYEAPSEIFLRHLNRVSTIAKKYDFELIMWGDMFFRLCNDGRYHTDYIDESFAKRIPGNVTVAYWDYFFTDKDHYDSVMNAHRKLTPDAWFAGGIWTWTGFTPHLSYTYTAMKPAIESCRDIHVNNVLITTWGDSGAVCPRFSTLPMLYAISCFAKGEYDIEVIKTGFNEMFGMEYDDFMLLELPGTINTQVLDPRYLICNADSYMLFNDCFMGLFDCTVAGGEGEQYAKCAEKIRSAKVVTEYAYLFDTAAALCDVLAVKFDIGVRTRVAYFAKDTETLSKIVGEYDILIDKIQTFYDRFEKQWHIENKPQGFEVHDERIGGLIQRIKHCKKRMMAYLSGEIDSIPEIEEPVLDVKGAGEPLKVPTRA